MAESLENKIYDGDHVMRTEIDGDATVYRMRDASGEGAMTHFHVLPGIDLIYNDFHMQRCCSRFRPRIDMIGIDHCREGRIEWGLENGSYVYLQEGDLQITTKQQHAQEFGFPLNHYHGITVALFVAEAEKTLAGIWDGIPVDLSALRDKFCTGSRPFIMRAADSVKHIFSELYAVPESIRIPFFRIKVLELLLFLSVVPVPEGGEERQYFSKRHVQAVKSMMHFVTKNVEHHYTLEELSRRFHIPLTSMKNCFRGVFGTSVYAYMRTYRMQTAAFRLRQTHESITDIAAGLGYSNPSKFAAAFRDVMGVPPLKYRNTIV